MSDRRDDWRSGARYLNTTVKQQHESVTHSDWQTQNGVKQRWLYGQQTYSEKKYDQ